MWHVWERGGILTGFRWGNMTEKSHLVNLGVDGRINDLQEVEWKAWTGLIWLRMGTGGGLF
jgi:hypothetical protein